MFKFWPAILLTSCAGTYDHTPQDTKFNQEKRNWTEIYKHELITAFKNQDADSLKFFMEELEKEKRSKKY